jgi:myo-inositol-1-phosphate synthase
MSTPGAERPDAAGSQSEATGSQPEAASIKPHTGKLGIMIPGMGAVATTLIAGVEAVRRGFAKPIGSLTQMAPSGWASGPTPTPR